MARTLGAPLTVPAGKDAICVEISPPELEKGAALEEGALRAGILAGLEKTALCRPDQVEEVSLLRVPDAYPVYPLDYYETLQALWEKLGSMENLWSIGRSAQFLYNNMARSVSLGLDLAEHILKTQV